MIHSTIGLVHTIFACISLLTGTYILITIKGTRLHVKIGYVYVFAMLAMNLTGFGIFHVMIFVSLWALLGGMYPVLFRSRVKNWYLQHIDLMSWSIVGLYAAFVAEIVTRLLPLRYFPWVVGIGTFVVTMTGWRFIKSKRKNKIAKGRTNHLTNNDASTYYRR